MGACRDLVSVGEPGAHPREFNLWEQKMSVLKILSAVFLLCGVAFADGSTGAPGVLQAQGQELAEAMAHYGRARALLLSAIAEFDKGYKSAKPDVVFDSKSFRANLVDRTTDLERLLAPQARITKGGVKLEGDRRVLKTEAK